LNTMTSSLSSVTGLLIRITLSSAPRCCGEVLNYSKDKVDERGG